MYIAVRRVFFCFFFFKQKTAYEIPKRDWSSDVCSSDLFQRRADRILLRSRRAFAVSLPALFLVSVWLYRGSVERLTSLIPLSSLRIITQPEQLTQAVISSNLDRAVNTARDSDHGRVYLHTWHRDIDRRNLDSRRHDVHIGNLDVRNHDLASDLIVDGARETSLPRSHANRLLGLVANNGERNIAVLLPIDQAGDGDVT